MLFAYHDRRLRQKDWGANAFSLASGTERMSFHLIRRPEASCVLPLAFIAEVPVRKVSSGKWLWHHSTGWPMQFGLPFLSVGNRPFLGFGSAYQPSLNASCRSIESTPDQSPGNWGSSSFGTPFGERDTCSIQYAHKNIYLQQMTHTSFLDLGARPIKYHISLGKTRS